jgi:heme exporter protein A
LEDYIPFDANRELSVNRPENDTMSARSGDRILSVTDVVRTIAYHKILRGVSFELMKGDALAVVGPNGAGKTTLLRVLTGLSRPTSGKVVLEGTQGFVGHSSMLYDALSARENLQFFARLHGVSGNGAVEKVLDMVGLADRQNDRVGTFSRGMTQRISIARALLSQPDVLYLDEPLSGLDDRSCASVLSILSNLRDLGHAIVFVSHNFSAVAALATRVGYLVAGKMVLVEDVAGRSAEQVSERYREVVEHG